jgi:hypothetical protein
VAEDRYIAPGTRVRYNALWIEGGVKTPKSECGVVVHCWESEHLTGMYDCLVAFFGDNFPLGEPAEAPYVLRYAAVSLEVIE